MDKNGDGKLSYGELFQGYFPEGTDEDEELKENSDRMAELFKEADQDHDGLLDEHEQQVFVDFHDQEPGEEGDEEGDDDDEDGEEGEDDEEGEDGEDDGE